MSGVATGTTSVVPRGRTGTGVARRPAGIIMHCPMLILSDHNELFWRTAAKLTPYLLAILLSVSPPTT